MRLGDGKWHPRTGQKVVRVAWVPSENSQNFSHGRSSDDILKSSAFDSFLTYCNWQSSGSVPLLAASLKSQGEASDKVWNLAAEASDMKFLHLEPSLFSAAPIFLTYYVIDCSQALGQFPWLAASLKSQGELAAKASDVKLLHLEHFFCDSLHSHLLWLTVLWASPLACCFLEVSRRISSRSITHEVASSRL